MDGQGLPMAPSAVNVREQPVAPSVRPASPRPVHVHSRRSRAQPRAALPTYQLGHRIGIGTAAPRHVLPAHVKNGVAMKNFHLEGNDTAISVKNFRDRNLIAHHGGGRPGPRRRVGRRALPSAPERCGWPGASFERTRVPRPPRPTGCRGSFILILHPRVLI